MKSLTGREQTEVPTVLAIVVVRDGAPWLKQALASLARQTHPRLGVLAVDNGSTDGSAELLEGTLGSRRVLRLGRNVGFAAAVHRALSVPAARAADYVLLLHDDTALAPDAVARLVDTAGRVEGTGIVAPKTLDWQRPSVLLDIGSATDRFGYPYSPLEDGEIDQGQYDAVREVLFVSSSAMLVARAAWTRAGLPDERLRSGQADLEFCWRVRVAGFRVLVDPEAVALHRLAGERAERSGDGVADERYLAERAGLLSLLKNYRFLTLLWVLPAYAVQASVRGLLYLVTRHFDRTFQIARAWGWNVAHLPGTLRRRFRSQRARRVSDREMGRFMVPAAARLQRWALQASSLFTMRHERPMEEEDEPEAPPLARRTARLALAHPVAVAAAAAILVTVVAFRDVLFVPRVQGGLLPTFPDGPFAFFREFAAGWRATGFGGPGGGGPALVPLGLASAVALRDPHLLARLLVALTPALAGISAYRALRRLTGDAGGAVVGAAAYAFSALVLWTASVGSLPALAAVVAVPWLAVRIGSAFDGPAPDAPLRWVVATGAGLAVAGAFFPATWVAVAVVAAPMIVATARGGSRIRGLALTAASAAVAAALVFPFTAELIRAGGGSDVGAVGAARFSSVLRLSPGGGPGSWTAALFLPLAGVLAFPFVGRRGRPWGGRSLVAGGAAILLSWLAAAGYLPPLLSNPVAFLAAAAFSLSALVGLAMAALVPGVRRTAFGFRQVAAGALVAVLVIGLGAQVLQALAGDWAVRPDGVPPAWPTVATADPGERFRVLWLGPPVLAPFPAPGGEPQGRVEAGPASVSYAVTGRGGRSALALGLPTRGAGHAAVQNAVAAVLSGDVRHGGALLAPMGIRYVVAPQPGLPAGALDRMEDQLDLDLIQTAGGLRIYRNARSLPVASWIRGQRALSAARSPRLLAGVGVDPRRAQPLDRVGGGAWRGRIDEEDTAVVVVGDVFDPQWRLHTDGGDAVAPFPAFGWAVGFEAEQGAVAATFERRLPRTVEVVAFSVLWAAALAVGGRRRREGPPVAGGRFAASEEALPGDGVPRPREERAGTGPARRSP